MPREAPPVYIIPEEGFTLPAPLIQSAGFILFPIIAAISLYIPFLLIGYITCQIIYWVANYFHQIEKQSLPKDDTPTKRLPPF